MERYKNFLGLGIAGNFALHLDQAGEAEDFKDIITADEAAPKGMFPFFLPQNVKNTHEKLSTYPLSTNTIQLPNEKVNVQAEPEVGLVCNIQYQDNKISKIIPLKFGAYNDCSIRIAGAKKISHKKNWGKNSKGISDTLIDIDSFSDGGIMDDYFICSYLRRDGNLTAYGENVELQGYSYFYEKLLHWIKNQINIQEDFGPLEPIMEYIKECNYPTQAIISIGATRYTTYGEKTFLNVGDEVIIVVYNHKNTSIKDVEKAIQTNTYDTKNMSVLAQKVI
jgi:hypothetical protein